MTMVLRIESMTSWVRSEEHTSELQSRQYLVCRLLLEKKKNQLRGGGRNRHKRDCLCRMTKRDDIRSRVAYGVFFFNDTATTEIYTLSLHDALPNCGMTAYPRISPAMMVLVRKGDAVLLAMHRSEEHTSELQSRQYLVCRLLLE